MGSKGRNRTYTESMNINQQNGKTKGSNIMNIDTIRGCPFDCESCYAKKNSAISITNFEIPVNVQEFIGATHNDGRIYRIGNSGDPCIDWSHSEEIIKKYGIKNNFVVTKLLTTRGFTGFFKNLQVSVDTINEEHFNKTLECVDDILANYPDVKIVLRIRSISTRDIHLNVLQNTAVMFANMRELPVLETRVRFFRKDAFEKYRLNADDYYRDHSVFKPKPGKIFLKSVKKYYDCDLYGNKCVECGNCEITWDDKQFRKNGEFIADHMNQNPVIPGSDLIPNKIKKVA
jgi:hypothetical protein